MFARCRDIADSDSFEQAIIMLILLNAAVMGFETSPEYNELYGVYFHYILWGSQTIFACEIATRLLSYGPQFREFFRGFWNIFDFSIVALSFIPAVGPFVTVARVLRVLRVLRVISVSDRLRSFLDRAQQSLGVAFCTVIVWSIVLYVFAISGFYLFSELDPARWGSLGLAFRSLLFLVLLQAVPGTVDGLSGDPFGCLVYLFAYYLFSLFLLINAIGGVILNPIPPESVPSDD